MEAYASQYNSPPCPADPAAELDTPGFGLAGPSEAENACPTACGTQGGMAAGMLPTRTLSLDDKTAIDGFGRKMLYLVRTDLTDESGRTADEEPRKTAGHAIDVSDRSEAVREAHRVLSVYFTNQVHRMDYPSYRAKGWLIGSGPVEAACKQVVGQRMKGSGMRWGEQGADAVCHLRALFRSEHTQWTDFWRRATAA